MSPWRRVALIQWTAIAALPGLALCARAADPSAPRQIGWADLLPKGWDAQQALSGVDLASLQDGDPRANDLLLRLREAADNAPPNTALDGTPIRIAGFVVPIEELRGEVSEFLLVPYFGACIHTPPPPANQIIHVKAPPSHKGLRSMDVVWVSGTLRVTRSDTQMGVSGYSVRADRLERYTGAR